MPIFLFHVFNSVGTARDDEGSDLPDLNAAKDHALDSIRSIIAEEARTGRIDLNGHIEIADPAGETLGRVAYREAFDLKLGGASE
jgi:hypothetical protein